MKITNQKTDNSKIDLVELSGELTGSEAIELQEYLYGKLDEERFYQLVNLKYVPRVDGLGIKVISDFVKRAMSIGLFNVNVNIRMMLRLSGKEELFKLYNETDYEKVVGMFENDMIKADINEVVRKRVHSRIKTDLQAQFKYCLNHDGVISGKTNVINLSEGGLFASGIVAVDEKKGKEVSRPELIGQELYGMNFSLNGDQDVIEAKCECVREFRSDDKLSAGIRFKDISKKSKRRIKEYISNSICEN